MHLRSYLAPLQITPTRVGASPSLLVLSIWKWINFSFGQSTVALNRPSWLQRGLSPHRFSSPKILSSNIRHRACVVFQRRSHRPQALPLRGSAPQSHLHVYLCWCGCIVSLDQAPQFQQTTPVKIELAVIALPVVRDCRPQVRK